MRNIKIILEYDGTDYMGWQIQAHGITIQQRLIEAIKKLTGEDARVRAAGRTDSGVHAYGQTVNFITTSTIPGNKFAPALNQFLPSDITIRCSEEVAESFDSKKDSKAKRYRYQILNSVAPSALLRNRSWHVKQTLNIHAMKKAARYLTGENDYESFRSVHCDAAHAIRRIDEIKITTQESINGSDGRLITINYLGNAFCRHMVRIITGTLVETGKGMHQPQDIKNMLEARDRKAAGVTAVAHGLFLVEVFY